MEKKMASLNISKGKIKQTTIVKTILNTFKELLLSKELVPGSRLPSENEMVEQFGVGKSSIREAIKMLDAVGVIESKQGFGTFISNEPKEDSLNPLIFQLILQQGTKYDLFNFRKLYETGYTLMALDNMTVEDKLYIEKNLYEKDILIATGISSTSKNDIDFHKAILMSTHNPYVIRTGQVLIELYGVTLNKIVEIDETYRTKDYHNRIFDALCKKDKTKLIDVLNHSFDDYERIFLHEP